MQHDRFQKLLEKEMSRKEFLAFSLLAVASVFGIVGLIRELVSKAATPTASFETESGTKTGNATTVTDATASGSAAAKFGATTATSRESLTGLQGTYKPSVAADNVGIPAGTVLTTTGAPTGLVTLTGTGAYTYKNMLIKACFLIKTTGKVEFRNCKIVGFQRTDLTGSGHDTALINCDANPGVSNVLITDCELVPDYPDTYTDGVLGHNFEIRRSIVRNCVDCLGIRVPNKPTAAANTKIYANILTDLAYFNPDVATPRTTTNKGTHNDVIQVFGGKGHDIVGNCIWGKPSANAGTPPYGFGAPVGDASRNVYAPNSIGRGINTTNGIGNTTINIQNNWFDYSVVMLSLPHGTAPYTNATVKNNKFGTTGLTQAEVAVETIAPGLPTSTGKDTTNANVVETTGAAITINRLSGWS